MAIVNSISLLPEEDIQKTVLKVFGLNNRWLSAAIVNNCQIIKKLNHEEEISFCWYFNNMPLPEIFKSFFSIDFSLSLSDCFSYVRVVHILIPVFFIGIVFSFILATTNSSITTLFTPLLTNVNGFIRTKEVAYLI